MTSDFEDQGGGFSLDFGETAAGVRVPLRVDASGVQSVNDAALIELIINTIAVRIDQTTPGTTNGVQVNAELPAGTQYLGTVGGQADVIDVTLVLDTNIYADGDVMVVPQEIANAVRANGKRCILHSLTICDKDDQGVAFDLYFAGVTWAWGAAINAPIAIDDTNAALLVTRIPVAAADYYDLGGNRLVVKGPSDQGMSSIIEAAAASRSIFVGAVSRGAGTYSASGITLKLGLLWLD